MFLFTAVFLFKVQGSIRRSKYDYISNNYCMHVNQKITMFDLLGGVISSSPTFSRWGDGVISVSDMSLDTFDGLGEGGGVISSSSIFVKIAFCTEDGIGGSLSLSLKYRI